MNTKPGEVKAFFLNLLVIILIMLALLTAFFLSLGLITHHGESVSVPNVTGQDVNTATAKIAAFGLNPVVADSVFFDSLPPLSVVSQSPSGGTPVKDGRTVYITINRVVAPTVQMPDLTGYSLNSAKLLLKSFGLRLAGYTYTASLVSDAVVKQQVGGNDIAPGTRIPMGTSVGLIIGDGSGSQMMSVPDIVGMELKDARDYVGSMNCTIGNVIADPDVTSPDSAYVYKQSPSPTVTNDQGQTGSVRMRIGGAVDVWVSSKPPTGIGE